ncbi:hypothetical protein C1Y40_05103 [Mycobacterium talmoniae]|uniref:Uncharacterized protein n=1 Tax=Mycobacterium talmoniae TaxID=1858794 RepID=A0A2S8BDJ7_9MYCO|nr:hypothetical protein C1Y40_05103 [Mycobacterium talmoniae]
MLAEADPEGSDAALTAQWGCLRAANLFFNCGQVDSARRQLVDVRERVGAQPMVQLTTALDVLFAFFSGDLEMAIETGPSLCTAEVLPLATVWAAAPTAYGLGLVGRFDEVRAVADAGLRAAGAQRIGTQRFAIGSPRRWRRWRPAIIGKPSGCGNATRRWPPVSRPAMPWSRPSAAWWSLPAVHCDRPVRPFTIRYRHCRTVSPRCGRC